MINAIIVAAGKGARMKTGAPKQYLPIAGRPILGYTLAAFDRARVVDNIFLVAPEGDFDFCREKIFPPLNLGKRPRLVSGGPRRQDSSRRGVLAVNDPGGIVLIHDGARPFVDEKEIATCARAAKNFGACVIGVPCFDTAKRVNRKGIIEKTVDRDGLWLSRTPQGFKYDLIKKAFEKADKDGFSGTDEAGLVERMGIDVKMEKGSGMNMKITTPEDLLLAEAIFKRLE